MTILYGAGDRGIRRNVNVSSDEMDGMAKKAVELAGR